MNRISFIKSLLTVIAIIILGSCSDNNTSEISITEKQIDYRGLGDSISMISMQTLLSNVSREMKAGGPINAVDFCNIHATGITDSLSETYHASIGRISEKNRNPNNKATDAEVAIMAAMMKNKQKDTLIRNGDHPVYYKNIMLGMPACLKCHGNDSDISDSTHVLINERYPHDRATGYQLGDLRGAWKIVFNR